jgi:GTPase
MFIDSAIIKVKAGDGGAGALSFRHEKFVDKGGPDGGDGGNGGNVVVVADHNTNTLAKFRHQPFIRSSDGESGKKRRQHGKSGEDKIINLPVGTIVLEGETVLADLKESNQAVVISQGGKGGFGNAHFTSSVRQAPRISEIGEPGDEKEIRLELKLIADVGLVGMPNAGKSTFLSVVSNARPEIADYPFTTLTPHLGVAEVDDTSFLLADIPGLIEGASSGKGLGDEFLKHLERTILLLHLIDATSSNVVDTWRVIQKELSTYNVDLSTKPQIVVLTKADSVSEEDMNLKEKALKKLTNNIAVPISSIAHINVTQLLREVVTLLESEKSKQKNEDVEKAIPVITLEDDPTAWWVEKIKGGFEVKGAKISGFARRVNLQQADGEARLRDIMHKMGVDRELIRLGVSQGDRISIANKMFKW